MKILVINCGSSSIKFELFDMQAGVSLASGLVEKIGEPSSRQSYRSRISDGSTQQFVESVDLSDHHAGLHRVANWLMESGAIEHPKDLHAIGHRVAHGGSKLTAPTVVNEHVVETIRRLIPLAPLHNVANLCGIEVALAQWPSTPQVAIFDTAFHHTIPQYAHQYALPIDLAQKHVIRKYGFHGTSHRYVSSEAARLLVRPDHEVNLIVLHLGNGASATAVCKGKSVETSMGMTPLEGLVMGTRCGDLDPGIVLHIADTLDMSVAEVDTLLNRESGLKGICGSNDMREVLSRAEAGDHRAVLAIDMYVHRIKKYIGAYLAILPSTDAIVFTAGIGENSPEIRARVCAGLQHLGVRINQEKNSSCSPGPAAIHADESGIQVLVIPTNEELEMAKQVQICVLSQG